MHDPPVPLEELPDEELPVEAVEEVETAPEVLPVVSLATLELPDDELPDEAVEEVEAAPEVLPVVSLAPLELPDDEVISPLDDPPHELVDTDDTDDAEAIALPVLLDFAEPVVSDDDRPPVVEMPVTPVEEDVVELDVIWILALPPQSRRISVTAIGASCRMHSPGDGGA
jgi:hypothetical protein